MEDDCVIFTLQDPYQNVIATESTQVLYSKGSMTFKVENAAFWWPIGYGTQEMYTASAKLMRNVSLRGT